MDEPCYGLFELNFPAQGKGRWHRFQLVQVLRNGKMVEWRNDMGAVSKFKKAIQLRIPGGLVNDDGKLEILHTVGELMDIADTMRNLPPHEVEPRDLSGDYQKYQDTIRIRRKTWQSRNKLT